ncbi:hypothetical protein VYU27_006300 [Nannochloropsis oceanica]
MRIWEAAGGRWQGPCQEKGEMVGNERSKEAMEGKKRRMTNGTDGEGRERRKQGGGEEEEEGGGRADDGGGELSPEELLRLAEGGKGGSSSSSSSSFSFSSASTSAAVAAAATAATAYTALKIPHVDYPPVADEDTLRAIPQPFHFARDRSLPSLDPAFLAHHHNTNMVPSAKMRTLIGILRETRQSDPSGKFVVFSQFPFGTIAPCLEQAGFPCVSVTSQCRAEQRQQAVGAFTNKAEVKVILVGMGVGAAGLTLTAAKTLILLEPSHNLADEAQAMSRIHRIGQEAKCVKICVLFTRGTIEERMLKMRLDEGGAVALHQGGRGGGGEGGGEEGAALSVAATGGGEKSFQFSLASLQRLLGLDDGVERREENHD